MFNYLIVITKERVSKKLNMQIDPNIVDNLYELETRNCCKVTKNFRKRKRVLLQLACTKGIRLNSICLAKNYMDRYLDIEPKSPLILVSSVCLALAAKIDMNIDDMIELYNFVSDTVNFYALSNMEIKILRTLNYEMMVATEFDFMSLFLHCIFKEAKLTPNLVHRLSNLCCYLLEISIITQGCFEYLHSIIATSVIILAGNMLYITVNSPLFITTAKLETRLQDIQQCLQILHKSHYNIFKNKSWSGAKKYASVDRCSVAEIHPLSTVPIVSSTVYSTKL